MLLQGMVDTKQWVFSHFGGLTDTYVMLEGKRCWRSCGTISPFYWWENRSNWFAKSHGLLQSELELESVSRYFIFILYTAFMCVLQAVWIMWGKSLSKWYLVYQTSTHIWFWGNRRCHLLSAYYVPGTVLCATYMLSLNPHNERVNMSILKMRRVGTSSSSQMISVQEGLWTRVWLLGHVFPNMA